MTDLRVLSFAGSIEAKYSSTDLNLGELISFRLLVGRFFIKRVLAPNDKAQLPRSDDQALEMMWVARPDVR